MFDQGFTLDVNCRVVPTYPTDLEKTNMNIWPTIAVEVDDVFGRDVELGSREWPTMPFEIAIFAKGKGQKKDLSYAIWDNLREQYINIYNFTTVYPNVPKDYTGIPIIGQALIDNVTISPVREETTIRGEQNQSLIDGLIFLSNS